MLLTIDAVQSQGQHRFSIETADYSTDAEAIASIRVAVFVEEQQVPVELELDERDAECLHLLAMDGSKPIGTGRIDFAAAGKIGRVAVSAERRGQGVGTALMHAFHNIARERGLSRVWCNAQLVAAPFYRKLGYAAVGAHFYEAGIEHVRMEYDLGAGGPPS